MPSSNSDVKLESTNGDMPSSNDYHAPPGERNSAALWSRAEQMVQHDQEKTNFIRELICRYECMRDAYQREITDRQRDSGSIQSWQLEKLAYEQQFKSMRLALERDPFVLVLIDGDGMVFRDELVALGEQGGRQAAAQLHNTISSFVEHETDTIPTSARILCRIYAHVRGLAEVLVRTGVVEDVDTVEHFSRGFTRGKTMFDFIDVGPGKDRADEKIIEHLKLNLGDFHCRHIFFGCSHDNGYARILEDYAGDTSFVSRVTLLEGVPFEKELSVLPYQTRKYPQLFRGSKIVVRGAQPAIPPGSNDLSFSGSPAIAKTFKAPGGLLTRFSYPPRQNSTGSLLLDSPNLAHVTPNLPRTPSSSTSASVDGSSAAKSGLAAISWAAKAAAPAPATVDASPEYKPTNRDEIIARNRVGQRVDPPCRGYDKAEVDRIKKMKMCNVHFLRSECPYGDSCTHSHDYKPSLSDLAVLRLVARMAPCQYGSGCQDLKCIYGHRCPAPAARNPTTGAKPCIFGDNCKFSLELHNIDCAVVRTLCPNAGEVTPNVEFPHGSSLSELVGIHL